MNRLFLFALPLAYLGGCLGTGCQSTDQNERVLTFLERGKASGEMTLMSNGAVAAGVSNKFTFGADNTDLSFSGRVNFNEALIRTVTPNVMQACCMSGACFALPAQVCVERGGVPQGDGVQCASVDCSVE